MTRASLLEVDRLARRFGTHEVVRSLTLRLEPGERVALTGPNGVGKTTILRCIAGSLIPSAGRVLVHGAPAGSMAARRHVGASLSQERSFYLRLSGRENLLFFASVRHGSRRGALRAVKALEEELELEDIAAERVDRCSSGMLQQLGFARALLGDPPLLILDEPTRSLDTGAVERVWTALERRPDMGMLVATHRQDDVDHCHGEIGLPA